MNRVYGLCFGLGAYVRSASRLRRRFHTAGLDVSTRSPGAAVVDVEAWKVAEASVISCPGSSSAEDFHASADEQIRTVKRLHLQHDNIALWAIEDFMRYFLPGMSHSRGMFSLAYLNAVVSHSVWSNYNSRAGLRSPLHAMPNRVRGLFGVDVIAKHLDSLNSDKKPVTLNAAAKKQRIKLAAAAACIRTFPSAVEYLLPRDSLSARGSAAEEKAPPHDSDDLGAGVPRGTAGALHLAEEALLASSTASDVADAILVAAYGGAVATEAAAMMTCNMDARGMSADGSLGQDDQGQGQTITDAPEPPSSSGPAHAIWRAASENRAEDLLPKRFHIDSNKTAVPSEGSRGDRVELLLRDVLAGLATRHFGVQPAHGMEHLQSCTSPRAGYEKGLVPSVSSCVETTRLVLCLQPSASALAQGAAVVLASTDLWGTGEPDKASKAGKSKKKAPVKRGKTQGDPSKQPEREEALARNAIARAYRSGRAMAVLLDSVQSSAGTQSNSTSQTTKHKAVADAETIGGAAAADALIVWLGAPAGSGKAARGKGPSAVAAADRIKAAARKWARNVRAATEKAVQQPIR